MQLTSRPLLLQAILFVFCELMVEKVIYQSPTAFQQNIDPTSSISFSVCDHPLSAFFPHREFSCLSMITIAVTKVLSRKAQMYEYHR